MKKHKILVTGGAGFIGSHLVDNLAKKKWEIRVFDNLSNGSMANIAQWHGNRSFDFIEGDMQNANDLKKAVEDIELVFHFAANPEVRVGETNPDIHFRENLVATFNLLEAMRKNKKAQTLVFASTSTVYGEASAIPTPETYGPLIPISTYGASKLGCEALTSSYAYTFGIRCLILRFANVVGSRAKHGVITDFIRKLKANPRVLEILGDGSQKKSYLHIDDCIEAILLTTNKLLGGKERVQIFNIGAIDQVNVKKIAEIVRGEMNLPDADLVCTGGVDGGRGWLGDVKNMHLSIKKLIDIGWKPRFKSGEAIRLAARSLIKETCET